MRQRNRSLAFTAGFLLAAAVLTGFIGHAIWRDDQHFTQVERTRYLEDAVKQMGVEARWRATQMLRENRQ